MCFSSSAFDILITMSLHVISVGLSSVFSPLGVTFFFFWGGGEGRGLTAVCTSSGIVECITNVSISQSVDK